MRKFFHLLVLLMFVPAVLIDPEFVGLALSIATSLFLLAEVLRVHRVMPLDSRLVSTFLAHFIDDRDEGAIVLTHIYLLVGCAIPLWADLVLKSFAAVPGPTCPDHDVLMGPDYATHLLPLCGVLSLGVLDAIAAAYGKRFGKLPWPGTKKTIEGTGAATIGTTLFAVGVAAVATSFRPASVLSMLLAVFVPVAATSLLEAFTLQIDNLVLPVYYFVFVGTWSDAMAALSW